MKTILTDNVDAKYEYLFSYYTLRPDSRRLQRNQDDCNANVSHYSTIVILVLRTIFIAVSMRRKCARVVLCNADRIFNENRKDLSTREK